MIGIRCLAVATLAAGALGWAGSSQAYPGGTPRNVTNAGPFCARCHSSADAEQLRDMPAQAQAGMLPEKKHYAGITAGEENYGKLSEADRGKLLEAVKAVDANSKVTLAASSLKLKRGAPLTITVNTHGGAGPVVGVMLTDTDLRNEAGPVQGEGFYITKAPEIYGMDGKIQTKWLDGRFPGLSKNLNYVNIQDVKSDATAGTWADCKVVYSMRAPMDPGEYTVSAAFLYGTEKASALGRVQTPDGRVVPVGGGGADSGRIQFAKTIKITVL
jgi:hypothetical protein